MFYSLSVYPSLKSIYKTVEADSKEEAEAILEQMRKEFEEDLKKDIFAKIKIECRCSSSDENYKFGVGGVYLYKRYSTLIPVICVSSGKRYGYRQHGGWEHRFKYFDGGKTFSLRVRKEILLQR